MSRGLQQMTRSKAISGSISPRLLTVACVGDLRPVNGQVFAPRQLRLSTTKAGKCDKALLCTGQGAPWAQGRSPLVVCGSFSTQTNNPAFGFIQSNRSISRSNRDEGVMTVNGTVQKSAILLAATCCSAAYVWMQIFSGNVASIAAVMQTASVSGVVAFVCAIVTMFNPTWAPTTSWMYAISQGVGLGAMSAMMELHMPGVAMNAVLITMGTAGALMAALQSRIITLTDRMRDTIVAVTGGFFVMYLVLWLLSLVGVSVFPLLSSGPIGICFSLFSAGLAAFNLLMDMDSVRECAYQGMPKWMEWYSGFSMMITLVWMYTSVLRLLSMLSGWDNN